MSDLKVTGTITKVLNPESGTSQSGKDWRKQDFLITTGGEYPNDIAFNLFGDKMDLISNVKIGDEVEVSFNLNSREYNEKFYTNVNAWKIILTQPEPPKTAPEVLHEVNYENDKAKQHNQQFENATDVSESEESDLVLMRGVLDP